MIEIVAIFPMYEFGIMAYDVAVIRCIVVAIERNMSYPWLIEKTQILKKILKHSLSPIKYRIFATERLLIKNKYFRRKNSSIFRLTDIELS